MKKGVRKMQRRNITLIAIVLGLALSLNCASGKKPEPFNPEPYYDPENYVMVEGIRTCYLEAGDGEALILVHGWCGNAFNWMDVFDDLAADYHTIALDLPGSGKSGCDPAQHYDVMFYADFVARFMDILGIEKAHLVGHSMGGHVVAMFALRHPERLDMLVLVDAAGIGAEPGPMALVSRLLTPSLVIPMIHLIFPVKEEKLATVPASERRRVELAEERYGSELRECTGQALSQSMRSISHDLVRGRLAEIQAPTLVVWCEDDDLLPVESASVYKKGIKEAELITIKSCGHTPMQCRPEKFTQAVKEFLSSP
jgi:abhydrolase domain-containing protein 6